MIYIEERKTEKVPGITSLFVTFEYSADIVNIIKQCDCPVFNKKKKEWEVPISNLSKLVKLLNNIDDITLTVLPDKRVENSDHLVPVTSYKTKPFPYQLEGIEFGLNHLDGWLLLDAPGLGKTLQMLYLAQELKEQRGITHCLIICGVNSLKFNWANEVKKHTDLSCRILGQKTNRKGLTYIGSVQDRVNDLKTNIEEFYVITNIETLRNDDIVKYIEKGPNKFEMIVLDEIHTCKSQTSQQGKNLLKLKSATYKIGLTGTILLNNPLDCYVPLKWIGNERSTMTNFKYYYCQFGGPFNNMLMYYKNLSYLKDQLNDVSLRRTKELLTLPEKNIIDEFIDMNPQQQKFYDDIVEGIVDSVDKVSMSNTSLLSMVTRLRQATACPSMLTTENIKSSKIERAIDLVDQITSNNEKVVLFSTFKETANELYSVLNKSGNCVLCTGDMKDQQVNENIRRFQNDPSCNVMIATWQKMGTGFTLTSASYMIFLDCSFTAAQNEQCEDRIHRIGTSKPVFIYYLWCKGTMDERVREIVKSKEAISDFMVDDKVTPETLNILRKYILSL